MAVAEQLGPRTGQVSSAGAEPTRDRGRTNVRQVRGKEALVQLLLGILGLGVAAPLLFIASIAFKSQSQWVTDPLVLVPRPFTTENLGKFLHAVDLARMMTNTLAITVASVVGTLASCAVVAYPLA